MRKVPVEARLTPEVAIWAAALVVPVVSSGLLQAVIAAAKGIAKRIFFDHQITREINLLLKIRLYKLHIFFRIFQVNFSASFALKW